MKRYLTLKKRVATKNRAFHSSMQHNGHKKDKEAEEILKKLESWKALNEKKITDNN